MKSEGTVSTDLERALARKPLLGLMARRSEIHAAVLGELWLMVHENEAMPTDLLRQQSQWLLAVDTQAVTEIARVVRGGLLLSRREWKAARSSGFIPDGLLMLDLLELELTCSGFLARQARAVVEFYNSNCYWLSLDLLNHILPPRQFTLHVACYEFRHIMTSHMANMSDPSASGGTSADERIRELEALRWNEPQGAKEAGRAEPHAAREDDWPGNMALDHLREANRALVQAASANPLARRSAMEVARLNAKLACLQKTSPAEGDVKWAALWINACLTDWRVQTQTSRQS